MVIKTTKQVQCEDYNELITLHEYIGLEGAWYTEHWCPKGDLIHERRTTE
jgi:hypothetical protein